ncbi:MAG: shikimate dehydrogenase [Actinobacteria bacterium]|nr:shikimate dehydrogenase [Actinomycetota bacterium]
MSDSCALPVSAQTRLLAVIGHPVGHSLSPLMHNAALRYQGIDAIYLAFDVLPDELAVAVDGLRALGFWGANITLPHKEQATDLMDSLDPLAERVGAVNTVVNEHGRLVGYNTDVQGFLEALHAVHPRGATGAGCLVAGAGGAARAVVAGLIAGGAREITVFNRTSSRAHALCAAASRWGAGSCRVVERGDLGRAAEEADILVNATSVGLGVSVKESVIPVDTLRSHHVVVDLVYGMEPTLLVKSAVARGAATVDGKRMLVSQAAESYRLWTGKPAPFEVMRSSVERVGR